MVGSGAVGSFSLPKAKVRMPLLEADTDAAVLRIPGVAEYLVRADGSVETARDPRASDLDVACFHDGPVAALRLLLQGSFPLRAAAVAQGGGAIVLGGASAVGKSAVAAALALRGCAVLADKVVVVANPDLAVTGTPPAVELWPPMVRALDLDAANGRPVRPALVKQSFGLGPVAEQATVPAALVVVLDIDNRLRRPELRELTAGRQKLHAIVSLQWHRRLIAPLGLGIAHFEWAASVAAKVRTIRLSRPRHEMTIDEVAGLIETSFRQSPSEGSP